MDEMKEILKKLAKAELEAEWELAQRDLRESGSCFMQDGKRIDPSMMYVESDTKGG